MIYYLHESENVIKLSIAIRQSSGKFYLWLLSIKYLMQAENYFIKTIGTCGQHAFHNYQEMRHIQAQNVLHHP